MTTHKVIIHADKVVLDPFCFLLPPLGQLNPLVISLDYMSEGFVWYLGENLQTYCILRAKDYKKPRQNGVLEHAYAELK